MVVVEHQLLNLLPGDQVYILLGSKRPIILRPARAGTFKVGGTCLVQGLVDGEGLLGPVPYPWAVERDDDIFGIDQQIFVNISTGQRTREDPRLPPLPKPWGYLDLENQLEDQQHPSAFRNAETGKILMSDPRLLTEALEQRGIELETVRLV